MTGRLIVGLIALGAVSIAVNHGWNRPPAPSAAGEAIENAEAATPRVVAPAGEEAATIAASQAMPRFSSTNGRRLDLEGSNVAAFLDRVTPLARKGDPDAAYRVYQAEAMCGSIAYERKWIRDTTDYDADAMEAMKRGVEGMEAACAGVTPAQMQERFGFLEQAIRADNHAAMLDYRTEGPLGLDIDSFDSNDSRLVDWKRRSHAYLDRLAADGEREAWRMLVGDYQMGDLVERDDGAAIKYRVALVVERQPDRNLMSLGDVAEMARQMKPVEVQSAIDQGRALARQFPLRPR